jgi:STE24 endopeptidase
MRVLVILLLALACVSGSPRAPVVPAAARASNHFDVRAATDAWLATVPPDQKRRSDAYFEGGYYLMVWDFLFLVAVMILLLQTGLSVRMRNLAERLTRASILRTWIYWLQFCTVSSLLLLPLTIYENFVRERQYGLMNETFASWFRDALVGFAVLGLLLGGIAIVVLVTVIQRLPRSWPYWGTAAAIAFTVFASFIEPVFLAPLFNSYTPLANGPLKSAILAMASANGISAETVYEENASKQSKRVSAFVSGFGSTERITLNDNLLNRVSPQGVMSVMGHEMGHYVMHHIANGILFSAVVILIAFLLLRGALLWGYAKFGTRWRIRDVSDVAFLPYAVVVLAAMSFLFTPIGNTFTRTQEFEADLYGLNAARQPDGEAEVDVLLGEYRKLDPGPIEEFLFYDHPSGRTRIEAAMRWKAQNQCLFLENTACPFSSR